MKALIIEKESLEQMYEIREKFYVYPSTKGKMHWEQISVEEIIKNLDNDGVMVFTQKHGEVSGNDLDKFIEIDNRVSLSQAASALGKLGGAAKTEAKASASRANGKLGGRPKAK